jgi:SNF2 family DNA or RNA helicase
VHRIGQLASSVHAVYFIGKDTLDEQMIDKIMSKFEVISNALDGDKASTM